MIRNVIISKTAENKLDKLFYYLETNWNLKVKLDFIKKLDKSISIIKLNPKSFPKSEYKKGLHKCVITKQTTLFLDLMQNKLLL